MCVCVWLGGYGSEGSDIVLSVQEEKGMPESKTLNRMVGDRSKRTERQQGQRKKSEENQPYCNDNMGLFVLADKLPSGKPRPS